MMETEIQEGKDGPKEERTGGRLEQAEVKTGRQKQIRKGEKQMMNSK
jgi:hypothetical protein